MFDKFTLKAQEALKEAHDIASNKGQQQIDVLHVALALVLQKGGIVPPILEKLGANVSFLETEIEKEINRLPKIKGEVPFGQAYLSPELGKAINQAAKEAMKLKDEFISCEHLLLALVTVSTKVKGL